MTRWLTIIAIFLAIISMNRVLANVCVMDDSNTKVCLKNPVRRVITLAPHATEIIFAAGGGNRLVGIDRYSNYPPETRKITKIGDLQRLDLERILSLKPDLIIAWLGGTPTAQLDQLRKAAIPIYLSQPTTLEGISQSIVRFGKLLKTDNIATQHAKKFDAQLNQLRKQYADSTPLRIFYQVASSPLYTINNQQIISKGIALCGGINIFSKLKFLSASISLESVLAKNPQVILSGTGSLEELHNFWKRFSDLSAVTQNNIFVVNPDWMDRAGPRMLDGIISVCVDLARARKKLKN